MYGIALTGGRRNHAGVNPETKLLVYVASSALAGVVAGLSLGALGSLTPRDVRAVVGLILSVAGLAIGVSSLVGRPVPVLQWDRETPATWVDRGPLFWAASMAVLLGFGGSTRIGFWLWYCIPAVAFVSGSVGVGAAVWGTYGLVRGGWTLAFWMAESTRTRDMSRSLLSHFRQASVSSYWVLAVTSAYFLVVTGS